MNLFGIGLGFLAMVNGDRAAGKKGNLNMAGDRYIWQHPRCKTVPSLCDTTCMANFTTDAGSITIGPDDYSSIRHCLWVCNRYSM